MYEFKICTKCGKEKNVDEFCRDRSRKDGLRFWCKECAEEYHKQYRKRNKKKIKEYQKQYCKENKEKREECQKQWREENRKWYEQWYKENEEKIKEYRKQYAKEKAKYNTFAEQISFCEETRRSPDDYTLLQVRCTESGCRKWFNPTNLEVKSRIQSLNGQIGGESRFYCSEECKQICSLYQQKKYPKGQKPYYDRADQGDWAKMVLERDNYECQRCGLTDNLVAHHIEGIQENPFMSCDIDLGITLCKKCHKESHKDVGCRYLDLTRRNLCV